MRPSLATTIAMTSLLLSACAAPNFDRCSSKQDCRNVTQTQNDGLQKLALSLQTAMAPNFEQSFRQGLTPYQAKGKLNKSPQHQARVQRIAKRILPIVQDHFPYTRSWDWEVHVVSDPTINAYASPGGKIVFYTGLIDKLKLSDDEIAAVMGHEMVHAADMHGVKGMGIGMLVNITTQVAASKTGVPPQVANMASQIIGKGYSRSDEYEADHWGSKFMVMAGYNPRAAISMQTKLEQASQGGNQSEIFSSHPIGINRVQELEKAMPDFESLYLESKQSKVRPSKKRR